MSRSAERRQSAKADVERAKIWRAVRGLGQFSVYEIEVITGADPRRYLGWLRRCGYVRTIGTRKAARGGRETIFHLVKNTGPRAPRMAFCLFDPNTGFLVGGCRDVD